MEKVIVPGMQFRVWGTLFTVTRLVDKNVYYTFSGSKGMEVSRDLHFMVDVLFDDKNSRWKVVNEKERLIKRYARLALS